MKDRLSVRSNNNSTNIKTAPKRSLGPVSNLEEYVQADWWRRIFDSVYIKTDGDVVDDAKITKMEVDYIERVLNLKPDDKILDLCCGQGRHSLELARRGFRNVEGLDRSHYLIQKAKMQAKKEVLPVKFREGDARKLPYPEDTFDVVLILGNSFGYFETIEEDIKVLKEVFKVLKPWGRILIDIADGEYLARNFQPRSWEWMDKKHFVCRERSLSVDKKKLISREVVVHVEKGVIADRFYAERLYTKEEIDQLLKATGFSDITFHGEIKTESQRGQDLGMMERRILVSAIAKKEWQPFKIRKRENTKNVIVLLGDPSKPDPIRPNRLFDEDDFYTIAELKNALKELQNTENRRNFSFLDNHSTLIYDLVKLKPKIDYVFNLCDEGFDNDPRKEAHIPALLEILGIPYTGAGPQCLIYCYDKSVVRGVAREMGIPTAPAFIIKPEDTIFELQINFPVIVKPNFGDSSFGINQKSVAYNIEELINAIIEIRGKFGYDKPILVEKFLTGKDLTCGIIGNPPDDYIVLPIGEEDYSALPPEFPRICGYEAKWLPDSPYHSIRTIKADLPERTAQFIVECSLKLFERLGCRDYARFDWRLDEEGNPHLLEVNPNPGWCWDGHLAKLGELAGYSYPEVLSLILRSAEKRLKL